MTKNLYFKVESANIYTHIYCGLLVLIDTAEVNILKCIHGGISGAILSKH